MRQSVQSSLENFTFDGQEPYLDSLVLHSPMSTMANTWTVWKTLESYTPHRIRHLGISNTTLSILDALYARASLKPAVVQNRFYNQTDYEEAMRAYCRDKGIVFQSFWTLSSNKMLVRSEPVAAVAQKAGVDAVAAYYSLVLGLESLTILDGTTDPAHMASDLEGIEKVGLWAEGDGAADWDQALSTFKAMIGDI